MLKSLPCYPSRSGGKTSGKTSSIPTYPPVSSTSQPRAPPKPVATHAPIDFPLSRSRRGPGSRSSGRPTTCPGDMPRPAATRTFGTSKDPNSQVPCSGDDTLFPGPWGLLWGSCQGIPPRDPPGIPTRESAQGFTPGSHPKGSSLGPKQMGSSGMPWGDAVGGSPGETSGDLPLVDQDCVVTRKGLLSLGFVSL